MDKLVTGGTQTRPGPRWLRPGSRRARAQSQERRPRRFRATRWWFSPAFRVRASRRWPSARSMPRRSGGISNRFRPMRGACSTRWRCPRSTRSRACRRRWPCSSSAARRRRARRSAASRRCPTCCGCCIRAPAIIRAASRCSTPNRSRPTRRRAPARNAMGSAGSTRSPKNRWCRMTRLTIRERAVAAWPTAWHGQNLRDILVTLGYDVDRPWRELPKKDRDWILFTDEQPTVPVYAGYDAGRGQARAQAQGGAELSGHLHRRQTLRAADLRHDPEPADEEAGGAVSC